MFRLVGVIACDLGAFALALAALFAFGPREPLTLKPKFDARRLPTDLDAYLAAEEAVVAEITPGTEKRIVWADAVGARTEIALVYLHGFSATSAEIRPVPENLAKALGANLYLARFAGHGVPGVRLAGPSVQDWMDDTAEALAIGQRLGRRVIVIGTSTGGTLAAEAALQPDLSRNVAGFVFISPNFGIRARAAIPLNWPMARLWVPKVAGAERCFPPRNPDHAKYWTTCYPTVALLPVAAVAQHAAVADYHQVGIPALFLFTEEDQVVSPAATQAVVRSWGRAATVCLFKLPPGNDPFSHVIAGDILSPGMTAPVTDAIAGWIAGL